MIFLNHILDTNKISSQSPCSEKFFWHKNILTWKFIEEGRSGKLSIYRKLHSFYFPLEVPKSVVAEHHGPLLERVPFEPYRKIDAKCDKWKTLFTVGPRARYGSAPLVPSRPRSPCPSYQVFLYPSYRSILRALYKKLSLGSVPHTSELLLKYRYTGCRHFVKD